MKIPEFLFQKISHVLSSKKIYITKSLSFKEKYRVSPPVHDYIRHATLELCYEEIVSKAVKGNVAELGVYKGDFAKQLNLLFTDRKLYLFDTFEGFNEKDVAIEKSKGYSPGNQDFSDTSIELVKSKMLYPDNCIFKKGHFPQSAQGVEDSFCFVNIDTDLYEPIYHGLNFFYNRLEKGGYIFIHDFNNYHYPGARQAVLQFCNESNISYVPIPDTAGTVIITK